MILHFFNAHYH